MKHLRHFFLSVFILFTTQQVMAISPDSLNASGSLMQGESALFAVDTSGIMDPVIFQMTPSKGDLDLYVWPSYDEFLRGAQDPWPDDIVVLCEQDGVSVETCTFTDATALGKNIVFVEVYGFEAGDYEIQGSAVFPYSAQQESDYNDGLIDALGNANVVPFVKRFYELVLGRDYEDGGVIYWMRELVSQAQSASDAANGFFFSTEFLNKNHPDLDFVLIAYRALLGRDPGGTEPAYWVDKLNTGTTRQEVVDGFIDSQEFRAIAASYGILTTGGGSVQPIPDSNTFFGRGFDDAVLFVAFNSRVMEFVKRFYDLVLERDFEVGGMDYWMTQLISRASTASDIANGFFFSTEFKNKGHDDTTFVEIAYRTLLGREAEGSGLDYWVNDKLGTGTTREEVVEGFIDSSEFRAIAADYGIIAN